jgi:hypothetical protein
MSSGARDRARAATDSRASPRETLLAPSTTTALRPEAPPLKDCAGLLKQEAEPALREAFRSRPLADLLQDRPAIGAAVCHSLRNKLRPHGLWVDTCGLDTLAPSSHQQATSDAKACVALRLLRALHRRARSRARSWLRPSI